MLSLSRTITVSKLVEEIKTGSSKWIKMQEGIYPNFSWQSGYSVFSVGQSELTRVVRYIDKQEEHHHQKTFQEELREMLIENNIKYDERWIWD